MYLNGRTLKKREKHFKFVCFVFQKHRQKEKTLCEFILIKNFIHESIKSNNGFKLHFSTDAS